MKKVTRIVLLIGTSLVLSFAACTKHRKNTGPYNHSPEADKANKRYGSTSH